MLVRIGTHKRGFRLFNRKEKIIISLERLEGYLIFREDKVITIMKGDQQFGLVHSSQTDKLSGLLCLLNAGTVFSISPN